MFLFGTGFNDIISQVRYIFQKRKKVLSEFIIDETLLKVRNEFVWLWIAIEPIDKIILGIRSYFLGKEQCLLLQNDFYNKNWLGNMENIQSLLMEVHGIYPQACKFLNMNHHLHSSSSSLILLAFSSALLV